MRILLIISLVFLFFSCATEKVLVGKYNPENKSVVYKKGKDIYLFWDRISLQSIENSLDISNYEKVIKRSFFDNIAYYGTIGIFSPYSVKIRIEEPDNKTKKKKLNQ